MITANDIAALWVKMTATFGYRFTETYGRRDPGVWLDVLRGFMPSDLTAGFSRMLTHHYRSAHSVKTSSKTPVSIWPPNALEFRHYCEAAREQGGLPAPHEAFIEAKRNSYLSTSHWSHKVIKAAANCLYEEYKKSRHDPLYDEDYTAFYQYYVALRDAYLATEPVKELNAMNCTVRGKKVAADTSRRDSSPRNSLLRDVSQAGMLSQQAISQPTVLLSNVRRKTHVSC